MRRLSHNIIMLAVLALAINAGLSKAHAEVQLPVAFVYQYSPDVQIVLTPEQCSKDDPTFGFVAEAHDNTHHKHAYGCWRYAAGETVEMWLSPEPDVFIDLVFYKSRFKPVYAM